MMGECSIICDVIEAVNNGLDFEGAAYKVHE